MALFDPALLSSLCEDVLLIASPQSQLQPSPELQIWLVGRHGVLCVHRCNSSAIIPSAPHSSIPPQAPSYSARLKGAIPPVPQLMDRVRLSPQAGVGMVDLQLLLPPYDPLVRRCLEVLRLCLPAKSYLLLLQATLQGSIELTIGSQSSHFRPVVPQWPQLCSALAALLGLATTSDVPNMTVLPSSQADAFTTMLSSRTHDFLSSRAPLQGLKPAQPTPALEGWCTSSLPQSGGHELRSRVMLELHMLYEAIALDQLSWPLLRPLGALLTRICHGTGNVTYAAHYSRDFGCLSSVAGSPILSPTTGFTLHEANSSEVNSSRHPFSIFDWIHAAVQRRGQPPPLPPPPQCAQLGDGMLTDDGKLGVASKAMAVVVALYTLIAEDPLSESLPERLVRTSTSWSSRDKSHDLHCWHTPLPNPPCVINNPCDA